VCRVALIAAQKYLLCLGDLARYKEQVNGTSNYGRARQHYQKANHLDMRNGRPFNMLAILAKLSNRKFEAVYYHIRSGHCSSFFRIMKVSLYLNFFRWQQVNTNWLTKKTLICKYRGKTGTWSPKGLFGFFKLLEIENLVKKNRECCTVKTLVISSLFGLLS
jgi:hypothetical protein